MNAHLLCLIAATTVVVGQPPPDGQVPDTGSKDVPVQPAEPEVAVDPGSEPVKEKIPIPEASPEVLREVEYLMQGMKAGREAIVRAVVNISGQRLVNSPDDPSRNIDSPIVGLVAFDHKQSALRFDMTIPNRIGSLDETSVKEIKSPEDLNLLLRNGNFPVSYASLTSVRNKDYLAWYLKEGGSDTNLNIQRPDAPLGGTRELYHVIDLRSLGLIDYWDFHGMEPVLIYDSLPTIDESSLLCPLDSVIAYMAPRRFLKFHRDGDLTTIEWNSHKLTIDERKGFTPVEYVTTAWHKEASGHSFQSRTDWEEVNGVWVPVKAMIEAKDDRNGGEIGRYVLDLEWTRLNEEIPEELFDYRSFTNVDEGVYVIDDRGPEAKILGEWYDGEVKSEFEQNPSRKAVNWWLIVGSAALLIAMLVVWLRSQSGTGTSTMNPS
jgi:hypothetical protein